MEDTQTTDSGFSYRHVKPKDQRLYWSLDHDSAKHSGMSATSRISFVPVSSIKVTHMFKCFAGSKPTNGMGLKYFKY